jgi:hypothetical protein
MKARGPLKNCVVNNENGQKFNENENNEIKRNVSEVVLMTAKAKLC